MILGKQPEWCSTW